MILRLAVGEKGQKVAAVLGTGGDKIGLGRDSGENRRKWSVRFVDELRSTLVAGASVMVEVFSGAEEGYSCGENMDCQRQVEAAEEYQVGNTALEAMARGEVSEAGPEIFVGPVNTILVKEL